MASNYHPRFRMELIEEAVWNPVTRTEVKKLLALKRSMKEHGQFTPLSVVPSKNGGGKVVIADGHRRFRAAKLNGSDTIAVIINRGESLEVIYRDSTSKQRTGKETARIYLVEPLAVTERQRNQLDRYRRFYGELEFESLVMKGYSISFFRRVARVDNYCANNLKKYDRGMVNKMIKLAHWLVDTRSSRAVESYMKSGRPAGKILRAVRDGIPLYDLLI